MNLKRMATDFSLELLELAEETRARVGAKLAFLDYSIEVREPEETSAEF